MVLADVDRLVEDVSVSAREGDGLADVLVRLAGDGGSGGAGGSSGGAGGVGGADVSADRVVRVRAATVTVSGPDFRYRADAAVTGPVRRRTWTLHPAAWGLTLPHQR